KFYYSLFARLVSDTTLVETYRIFLRESESNFLLLWASSREVMFATVLICSSTHRNFYVSESPENHRAQSPEIKPPTVAVFVLIIKRGAKLKRVVNFLFCI
ncbi:MAG: hypothetical protein QME32_08300, partial [Endomicrobiia bacterium]|nr:hypothetical protein [Endomicrobiia bacterium]